MIGNIKPKNFDWIIFPLICLMLIIGAYFILSASNEKYVMKQFVWIGIGFIFFFMLLSFDYLLFAYYSYIIYVCVLCLLVLLLILGDSVKGTRRWFSIGSFSIQPSEFMKITLILALARFLRYKKYGLGLFDVGIAILLTIVPMALIIKQPDLGTALILVPVLIAMLYVAGIRIFYLISLFCLSLAVSPLLWFFVMHPYQKMRILGVLWPEKTADWGAGYHRLQSLIAVGSGGLLGAGWGNGSQNRLKFLPERHTDFIFAVIAEEWGFLRACFILFLYVVFFMCGLGIAMNTREPFGRLVVVGVFTMFATQVVVNIAMNLGIAPIVGMTLPFISYGGSSMLASFIALSIVFNVKSRSKIDLASE